MHSMDRGRLRAHAARHLRRLDALQRAAAGRQRAARPTPLERIYGPVVEFLRRVQRDDAAIDRAVQQAVAAGHLAYRLPSERPPRGGGMLLVGIVTLTVLLWVVYMCTVFPLLIWPAAGLPVALVAHHVVTVLRRDGAARRAIDRPLEALSAREVSAAPARAARLGRLLKAVAADIYCFQEVFTAQATTIAAALTTLDPYGDGATWTAHKVGDTVIATRGTLTPLPTQRSWQQHVGAAVDIAGRSLVVFTVRPVCCGHIGHTADTQRINEMKSVAATIGKLRAGTLGTTVQAWKASPLVVIGDWNMVGSRTPLDVMLEKSPSGPGLTHYLLRHLKGDDVFTWYKNEPGGFPPGMLDLLVHSAELTPRSGFVLDTAELEAATLTKLGLQQDDSQASDHLLLVVDLGTGSAPWGIAVSPPVSPRSSSMPRGLGRGEGSAQ